MVPNRKTSFHAGSLNSQRRKKRTSDTQQNLLGGWSEAESPRVMFGSGGSGSAVRTDGGRKRAPADAFPGR